MDSSESPFSNLDVWCDWNGDLKAPVEVTVSVEVRCTPNTHFPVLDTKSSSSVVQIVEYTIQPKPAKTDEIKQLADNADAVDAPDNTSEEKTPETPTAQRIASLGSGYTDTLPDAETPSTFSNSGSVIVRSGLPNGSPSSPAGPQDPFSSSLWVDVTNGVLSPGAVIPRKRNSETASLPESVSDSERTYGGYKHKSRLSVDSRTVSSSSSVSGQSKRPSLIPRPVSALSHSKSEPAKIPLPPNSAPVLGADYKRLDEAFPITPRAKKGVKKLSFSDLSSPRSPGSILSPVVPGLPTGLLNLEGLSKLSTVVSRGSPCDISALSSESSSSSDVNDENFPPDGVAVVQQSGSSLLPGPGNSPRLVLVNGVFSIRCPLGTEPGAYDVSITLLLNLQKGRPRDWWELVIPGLPRLSSNDHGYVYFRTPSDQGIEVRTTHFKRHTLIDSCLMAQFLIPSKIVIPFRLCDAQFYGFLRDFKVTQAIHADVESDGESEACLVKYNAVCSIDLIQRDFWAKQCGFFLYIYGGPQGEFSCHFQQSQQKLPTIHLDADPETRIGVSEVQVICAPSSLALFDIAWEVKLPRKNAHAWMPRIKASLDSGSAEINLQAEFEEAQASNAYEVVRADAAVSSPIEREQRTTSRKKAAWWKKLLVLFWCLCVIGCLIGNTTRMFYAIAKLYRLRTQKKLHCTVTLCPEGTDCFETQVVVDQPTAPPEVTVPFASQTEAPAPMENENEVPTSTPMPAPAPLPLRDRIDYLLGWRGPVQG